MYALLLLIQVPIDVTGKWQHEAHSPSTMTDSMMSHDVT